MAWIKRNLIFVVGLLVAVLLVGGGVFYLLQSMSAADEVSTNLASVNQEYDRLTGRDPYPSSENIKATRAEQDRIREFQALCRRYFGGPGTKEVLDDESFKALLETTLYGLDKDADRRGVKLPAGTGNNQHYGFTFSEQKKNLKFPPGSHRAFAIQLLDLEDICHILYESRIHSIVTLKRTAVGTNDPSNSPDILAGKKVTTNAVIGAALYPYEISFQCFSGELAAVLNNFARASNTYVLKTINVERGQLEAATQAGTIVQPIQPQLAGGMSPSMAARYGLRPQMMAPPPAAVAGSPSGRPGEVVLEEKPLRITIGLDVVRLASVTAQTAAPGGAAARPKAGARGAQ